MLTRRRLLAMRLLGGGGAAASPLLSGLLAWWSMDETSGTRVDSHGSYDLADENGVGYAAGVTGNAADFNPAASQWLKATSADLKILQGDFTIAGWIYLRSVYDTSNYRTIVRNGEGWGTGGVHLKVSSTRAFAYQYFDKDNDLVTVHAGAAAPLNEWYCFAARHISAAKRIELWNGRSGNWVTNTYTFDSQPGREDVFVGGPANNCHDGLIDELAIWTRALSNDEVALFYANPVYPA